MLSLIINPIRKSYPFYSINKIIPAYAYARKKSFFKLFGFLYHGTKLVEKTQKKFTKVRILDLVPVRNARKRYPPFS